MKQQLAMVLFLSASALAGCAASSNSAPIVYGTNPADPGRLYNQPASAYPAAVRRGAPSQYAPQHPAPRSYEAPRYEGPYEREASNANTYNANTYDAGAYEPAPRSIRATPYSRPAPLTPVSQAPLTQSVYGDEDRFEPAYVAAVEPVAAPTPRWSGAAPRLLTVRPGDTVYAIARRTGAAPKAIIAENRLRAPYALNIGQQLRIPRPEVKVINDVSANAARTYEPARQTLANQPASQSVSQPHRQGRARAHLVRRGDTLYSIARSSGVTIDALAALNGLPPPYRLSIGDRVRLPQGARASRDYAAPRRQAPRQVLEQGPERDVGELSRTVSYSRPAAEPLQSGGLFAWPVKGAVIGHFGSRDLGRRNDGVNIAAPVGTPVRAAADGEIVYRGSELDQYGNLLLIKHDDGYVTAYAHNDVMVVRKGERVKRGQMIAKVGQSGAAQEPQLHFEIRQNLKSVDPLSLLQ